MSNCVIENGNKWWYNVRMESHRLDGPAVEYANGDKKWYANGFRHRLDGPAIEYSDGTNYWYVKGKQLSGPFELLEHGANWRDLVEWMTPREIALCRTPK